MNEALLVAVVVLWILVIALVVAVFALARQIGVLYERVAPMGALMMDEGPKVGDLAPVFNLVTLAGPRVQVGAPGTHSTLVFFVSPTCPVCKKLIPVLRSSAKVESAWLRVVLASDGDEAKQRAFYEKAELADFPYVLSAELGMAFKLGRLPFAVLIAGQCRLRAKGLINSRAQPESLFTPKHPALKAVTEYTYKAVP